MNRSIDVTLPILDESGVQVEDMTVRQAIVVAFRTWHPTNDEKLTGDDKYRHFQIVQKIMASDEVSLSLEEKKIVKDRVGLMMTSLVVGRIWPLLDESLAR